MKKIKEKVNAGKRMSSDEGSGQAGNFESDGDVGTNYNASTGRTSLKMTLIRRKKKAQR